MSNENAENKQQMPVENIKAIAQLHGSEEINQVIQGVRGSQKRLDALLGQIKQTERILEKARELENASLVEDNATEVENLGTETSNTDTESHIVVAPLVEKSVVADEVGTKAKTGDERQEGIVTEKSGKKAESTSPELENKAIMKPKKTVEERKDEKLTVESVKDKVLVEDSQEEVSVKSAKKEGIESEKSAAPVVVSDKKSGESVQKEGLESEKSAVRLDKKPMKDLESKGESVIKAKMEGTEKSSMVKNSMPEKSSMAKNSMPENRTGSLEKKTLSAESKASTGIKKVEVSAVSPVAEVPEEELTKEQRAERFFKKPIKRMSLEELEAINRPRPKVVAAPRAPSNNNIQRSFINNNNGQRPPYNPNGARPSGTGMPSSRPPYNRDGQAPRPMGSRPPMGGQRPDRNSAAPLLPIVPTPSKNFGNKKKTPEKTNAFEDKKNLNKRTLIKKGLIQTAVFDEDRMGSRKYKVKKTKQQLQEERLKIDHATVSMEIIPIKVLSDKLGISATEITKRLFKDGVVKTINETLDYESAAVLALDMGITLELKMDKTAEEVLSESHVIEADDAKDMIERPAIVTVMGHVDHGKTSLLDAIRKTEVASGEAGGITQHIGAYTIRLNNKPITFIDTPGHEAFTAMRARGAAVTDIVVLVVAADDGVMPQTIEAINHAKAANVPIIVAINKIDRVGADIERIKQQLTEYEILCEEWGGENIMVPVSAHTGENIESLLESILLVAEVKGLKANPNRKARGTVIEAKLDKGQGPVATVLVQNGTLHVGDTVISGTTSGRIRAMLDDKGRNVKVAGPSYAVAILGMAEVPSAGDGIFAVEDERLGKQVLEERLSKIKQDMVKTAQKVSLDDVFSRISEGNIKGLNLIIKGDVQGSVEAVKQALIKLSNEEVRVNILHGGVGAITESDIMLAGAASAIVIGFNVRPDIKAKQLAEHDNVDVRMYRIIYEVIDDITSALKGMLTPKYKETICGEAEIRNVFKITGVGVVAGCYVTSGKMVRNAKLRLFRDNVVLFDSELSSLKRFKDDAKEVAQGFECGITIENISDIKEKDTIECYTLEVIKS